jgi:hypothetical protein
MEASVGIGWIAKGGLGLRGGSPVAARGRVPCEFGAPRLPRRFLPFVFGERGAVAVGAGVA